MEQVRRSDLVAVSAYLRSLLNQHDRYRSLWRAKAERRGGDPNIDAISRVIRDHLWTYNDPLARDDWRSYKDRVRRALNAQTLTPETLRVFMDAFGMSDEHRTKLQKLLYNPPLACVAELESISEWNSMALRRMVFRQQRCSSCRSRAVSMRATACA